MFTFENNTLYWNTTVLEKYTTEFPFVMKTKDNLAVVYTSLGSLSTTFLKNMRR